MASVPVRMVCLGRNDRSDAASRVTEAARVIGAVTEFVVDHSQEAGFDQGSIDWRGSLSSANWLVVSSSCLLEGEMMRGAWGASMTFSELEGSKTAMVVSVPLDRSKMGEVWGSVIERIRQISLLFLSHEAIEAVAEIEGTDHDLLLREVRDRGMVPIVCSFQPSEGVAIVSHTLGDQAVSVGAEMGFERRLAGFLCGLPIYGPGASGIEFAARSEIQQ